MPSEEPARGPARGWTSTIVLYVTFAATGVGLVLPGALLPVLLLRWSLNDEQAGALFFLFFAGSMSGALLARGRLPSSIARGAAATALGAWWLSVGTHASAFAAMAVYGLGLGIVMTSVSLMVSRRHPEDRTAQMTRLNLVWAVGACFGPWLVLRGSAVWGAHRMLYGIAAYFVLAGGLAWALVAPVEAEAVQAPGWWRQARAVPGTLLLMVPLATGIEAASGGWLATYSKRSGGTLDATIGAATCLWAGLLLSRLVQSNRRVAASSGRILLRFSPWLIGAGLGLLVGSSGGMMMLMGAFLVGFGVGPMYPAVLALVLKRGEGGNAIFVVAGVGSSVLPFVTGLVSGWAGSLRLGLCVLAVAAVVMAVCGWMVSRKESF